MSRPPYPAVYDTDLYSLLEVSPRARQEVIDAAYKSLMKICAPRALTDTGSRAAKYGEAHLILSDPTERRKYDDHRRRKLATIGPYRLLEKIGEGGFGITYKAEHTLHGGLSCIKHCSEMSPEVDEIFKQETLAIWNLSHYGLPAMRDFVRLDDGSLALAMSFVEGLNIEQAVKKFGRLDAENLSWMTERVLNTLMYLHDHAVVHGDIKPQNLIVNDKTHIVVLVDFGLSEVKPTSATKNKGYTDLFAPPEQLAGKTLVPGSDFYSLGKTMLYALSGNYNAVAHPEVPTDTPDALGSFIKKLIVQDVLSRPRSAAQLFEELKVVRQQCFGRLHSGMKKFARQ